MKIITKIVIPPSSGSYSHHPHSHATSPSDNGGTIEATTYSSITHPSWSQLPPPAESYPKISSPPESSPSASAMNHRYL